MPLTNHNLQKSSGTTKQINPSGYWHPSIAHHYHLHSQELSQWIIDFLSDDKETYVIDFGCGLGNYLHDLREAGYTALYGIEGQKPAKAIFDQIVEHDLTQPLSLPMKGNVITLEVGEHIPPAFESVFIDNITNAVEAGKHLILSWAARGQEGFGHVNCLDNKEVIERIMARGFLYLPDQSNAAREVITTVCEWYAHTVMIFKKG